MTINHDRSHRRQRGDFRSDRAERERLNRLSQRWATRKGEVWTEEEDAAILALGPWDIKRLFELSEQLGRTFESCSQRMVRLHPENARGMNEVYASEPDHPLCSSCFCKHAGEC